VTPLRVWSERVSRPLIGFAILVGVVVGSLAHHARADLDNLVFTSPRYRLKLVVPRTWRVTEQPSYPGFLLWLMRSQPEGRIVLTAETFTRDLYCSWPVTCRTSHEPLASRYACAVRDKLVRERMRVGPVQAGPKENEANQFPSVWFEYDDGSHFLRQAIAVSADNRMVGLVLSTPTEDARRAHTKAFDQTLRTLQSVDEAVAIGSGSGSGSAQPIDAPPINPIGPCP
jgi:hypothetical protein